MDPILVTVDQAAVMLSIGRSKAWELVSKGELPTVRIGRACRVPVSAIHDFTARQLQQAGQETDVTTQDAG